MEDRFARALARNSPPSARRNARPSRAARPVKPGFVEPMKALLVRELPRGNDWLYEVKFDGFRALAVKEGSKTSLISRNGKSLADRFPEIVQGVRELRARSLVLDGEVVALDPEGRSSFQLLQSQHTAGRFAPPLLYYVFDLLHLEGRDLRSQPLLERKKLLASVLKSAPDQLRLSASLESNPDPLLEEMKRRGLEGLIAKKAHSLYEAGGRSGAWVKFKWSQEQEFVIGGFTEPRGSRDLFGAILVGYYKDDRLWFVSKVGTGFDQRLLRQLHAKFLPLVQPSCPFANLPERIPGGLRAADMRRCTWIRPDLVCQIRFSEWTRDEHLRQPVFLGLRDDKSPKEVVREVPSSAS